MSVRMGAWFRAGFAAGVALLVMVGGAPVATATGLPSTLVLDTVDFRDTPLREALVALGERAQATKPGQAPVNFVIADPEGYLDGARVTLSLRNIPWAQALKYVCDLANAQFLAEGRVVVVGAKEELKRMTALRRTVRLGPGSRGQMAHLATARVVDVNFEEVSLGELCDYLRKVVTRDVAGSSSTAPLNVVIKENAEEPVATRRFSLQLQQVSVSELLHYATALTGCQFRIDVRAVIIGTPEDIARRPAGPSRPSGGVYERLGATVLPSVNFAPGTTAGAFIEAMNSLTRVNGVAIESDAVAASRLALSQVTALDALRYFNEVSGTGFRLDTNAYLLVDDPAVVEKPRPPEESAAGADRAPSDLGFDR